MGGLEARGTKKYLRTGASVRPSHLKNGIIIIKKATGSKRKKKQKTNTKIWNHHRMVSVNSEVPAVFYFL